MATRLPGALPHRPTTTFPAPPPALSRTRPRASAPPQRRAFSQTAARGATIVRRPRRPYGFTQLVQLSDGSTYTQRTASPLALYRSVKDTRNHALWQPNNASLRNVEVDEAGKLAAFRERFGRGWDADAPPSAAGADAGAAGTEDGAPDAGAAAGAAETPDQSRGSVDALSDLISEYMRPEDRNQASSGPPRKKK